MSSPSVDPTTATPATTGALRPLLDAAFGFFVWAAHLLVVYIATAVGCRFGLSAASRGRGTSFVTALVVVTLVAAAVVVLHGARRYRQQREVAAWRFRMALTVGCDAIATVAIAWQLLAMILVPLCA